MQADKISTSDKAAEFLVFLHRAITHLSDEKNQILILGIVRNNLGILRQESEVAELILTHQGERTDEFKDENNSRQRREFEFLIELTKYWLITLPDKEILHLIRANILFSELRNRWESVKSLLYVTRNSRKIENVRASLLMSRIIERSILQQRDQEQEDLNFDPQDQLKFESMSFRFIQQIQRFVYAYKSFWKLLLRENPSKQKLIETST